MNNIKGKSMCFYSSKGGVGKTTNLLNLAGVLSCENKKVLIIDFDLTSGAVATYLNIRPEKTIFNFTDDYINRRFNDVDEYVTKYSDNISVIASPKDPRQGAKIDPVYANFLIEKAKFKYDVVLIDTNHFLGELNINILDECDKTMLVLTNDLLDIKNMHNLIAVFKDAGYKNYEVLLNESISLYKKYYSMYDIKNGIKNNVDYRIPSNFFIKTIDKYIVDGKILSLEKGMKRYYPKVYKTYLSIINSLMEENSEK